MQRSTNRARHHGRVLKTKLRRGGQTTDDMKPDEQNQTEGLKPLPAAQCSASCGWHKKEKPIKDGDTPGCCGCGAVYATRSCEKCGETFLDWKAKGYDDVIAGPCVTTSGDLYCTRCGPRHDRAQEEADEDAFFDDGNGP